MEKENNRTNLLDAALGQSLTFEETTVEKMLREMLTNQIPEQVLSYQLNLADKNSAILIVRTWEEESDRWIPVYIIQGVGTNLTARYKSFDYFLCALCEYIKP